MFSAGLLLVCVRTTDLSARGYIFTAWFILVFVCATHCQSRDTSSPHVYNGFGLATDSQPRDTSSPQGHIVFCAENTVWSPFGIFSMCVVEEHTRHIFGRRRGGSSKLINFNHSYSWSTSNLNSHSALHLRPAGRYTRVATRTENSHVLGETVSDFWIDVAGVGSLKKYPCLAACASQRRQSTRR